MNKLLLTTSKDIVNLSHEELAITLAVCCEELKKIENNRSFEDCIRLSELITRIEEELRKLNNSYSENIKNTPDKTYVDCNYYVDDVKEVTSKNKSNNKIKVKLIKAIKRLFKLLEIIRRV